MSSSRHKGRGALVPTAVAAVEARLVFSEECGKAPGRLRRRRVEAAPRGFRTEGPRLRAAVEIFTEHDEWQGAARLDRVENKCGAGPVSLATGRLPRAPAQALAPKMLFIFEKWCESHHLSNVVHQY